MKDERCLGVTVDYEKSRRKERTTTSDEVENIIFCFREILPSKDSRAVARRVTVSGLSCYSNWNSKISYDFDPY